MLSTFGACQCSGRRQTADGSTSTLWRANLSYALTTSKSSNRWHGRYSAPPSKTRAKASHTGSPRPHFLDNNSDSGDRARWVYVVEGGDTGWRMYYQYLPDRGPFNREKIWHPYHEGQAAYIVPPIANFADGPSGLLFYSGVGLPADFDDRFLLCDFRGGPANSGVRSFRVKATGAFFEMTDEAQPFWKILATDIEQSPDGGLYISDWVNGWNGEGKGRIYKFFDPELVANDLVREVAEILGDDGFADRPTKAAIVPPVAEAMSGPFSRQLGKRKTASICSNRSWLPTRRWRKDFKASSLPISMAKSIRVSSARRQRKPTC